MNFLISGIYLFTNNDKETSTKGTQENSFLLSWYIQNLFNLIFQQIIQKYVRRKVFLEKKEIQWA